MATLKRLRQGNRKGTLGANLAIGATTIDFGTDPGFPTLGADEYRALVIEEGTADEEVVYLTAYTAAATTGTIEKAREGSADLAHTAGDTWVHGATTKDYDGPSGGAGLIGIADFPTIVDTDTTSTTLVDVDAALNVVSYVAPPSGKVLVRLTGWGSNSVVGNRGYWGLRDASGIVAAAKGLEYTYPSTGITFAKPIAMPFVVSGLTPGTAYSHRWAHSVDAGNTQRTQPSMMEVWAVNL